MKLKETFIVLLIPLAISLNAQVTPGFNYQAVARSANGDLIANQDIQVIVGIREGSENGTLVWEEAHATRTSDIGMFSLSVCGNNDLRSGGQLTDLNQIDWGANTHFLELKIDAGSGLVALGASQLHSVPYSMVANSLSSSIGELEIQPSSPVAEGDPLFMVRRPDGYPVFAVYEDRVWVYTDESAGTKGLKGGFAVGGYQTGKYAPGREYFMITPDSARIYMNTDNSAGKGLKGGFAVGGFQSGKAQSESFMSMTPDNYFIGQKSGSNITSGLFNSAMGYESGLNITTGSTNAFLGYQAGYRNSAGSGNLFLGYQSGYSNLDGNFNTFVGYQAGNQNFAGQSNTFLGSYAGYTNSDGDNNTFIGDSAGFNNLFGSSNTFMGTKAGLNNFLGVSNVFIGDQAGYHNRVGSENVFLGRQSGFMNDSTSRNVFIGTSAGYNHTTDWDNVFIGTYAGYENVKGAGNVYLGYEAGRNNVEGVRNVFIGNTAGFNEQGSNKLYIDNFPTDSSTALIWGDFQARKLRFNGSVGVNIDPIYDQLSVYHPWDVGALSLFGAGNGYDYSALRLRADTSELELFFNLSHTVDHSFALNYVDHGTIYPRLNIGPTGNVGLKALPTADDLFMLDNADVMNLRMKGAGNGFDFAAIQLESSGQDKDRSYTIGHNVDNGMIISYFDGDNYQPRMLIDSDGRVSINSWASGTASFNVFGSARITDAPPTGGGADLWILPDGTLVRTASDARMKSGFEPIANSLDKVLQLDGYTFQWNADESGTRDAGLIAQDVLEVFPEAVFQNEPDGYYGVNYSRFPALFVEAIKEQQNIIQSQRNEITLQQSEIENLKERLERMEALLGVD